VLSLGPDRATTSQVRLIGLRKGDRVGRRRRLGPQLDRLQRHGPRRRPVDVPTVSPLGHDLMAAPVDHIDDTVFADRQHLRIVIGKPDPIDRDVGNSRSFAVDLPDLVVRNLPLADPAVFA
jgi:hypothetical protein